MQDCTLKIRLLTKKRDGNKSLVWPDPRFKPFIYCQGINIFLGQSPWGLKLALRTCLRTREHRICLIKKWKEYCTPII